MPTYLKRILLILGTIVAAILGSKIPIAQADFILTLLVTLAYTGVRKFHKTARGKHYLSDTLLFIFVATSIIFSTGKLDSPFFFLTYFMLFGAGLLLDWVACLTIAIGIIAFFITDSGLYALSNHILQLLSLILIVPFSILLSREHARLSDIEEIHAGENADDLLFLSIIIKGHLQSLFELTEKTTDTNISLEMKKILERTKKLVDTFMEEK